MASIARDPNGRKRILFVAPDGKRKAIRLGKVSLRHAEGVKTRIEHLVAAQTAGCAWDGATAGWVAEIADVLADKLAAVGLIPKRAKAAGGTLGAVIDTYIAGRANLKPNTKRNYLTTRKHLVNHFGEDKPLAEITPGDADQWREWLLRGDAVDEKKKPRPRCAATVSREVKRARRFFRADQFYPNRLLKNYDCFTSRHCERSAATQKVLAETLTLSGLPRRLRLLAIVKVT